MQTKTLILTSQQNYAWHSMQEIIPYILETWRATNSAHHKVRIIDVDKEKLSTFFPDLIQCVNVVITCFTPNLFKLADYIRNNLKLNCRFIIHLHNQATIGCWPMRFYGSENLFQNHDIFISSCIRDAECLKITYPKAIQRVIPFSYRDLVNTTKLASPDPIEIPFIYIGRISSQKNIHTSLLALHYLKKSEPSLKWSFQVFGKEDGLGSPNMGLQDSDYQLFLVQLCRELEIEENVTFHGFADRLKIQQTLHQKRHIFISPSIHSDENFGMAAFQCLIENHLAILSDWGGHNDFKTHFPNQVELCNVYETKLGPFINPIEVKNALLASAKNYRSLNATGVSDYYLFESVVVKNKEILSIPLENRSEILEASEASDMILKKVKSQSRHANPKIFESYSDQIAHQFFRAYGMKKHLTKITLDLSVPPWVHEKTNQIEINDPHRGHHKISNQEDQKKWLFERGYAYSSKESS